MRNEKKELNMSYVKNILVNEISDLLGHKPSETEYKSALLYLEENIDDTTDLAGIGMILRDWRDDKCKECEQCGEYFLIEIMEEKWIGGGFRWVCGVDCAVELKNYFE